MVEYILILPFWSENLLNIKQIMKELGTLSWLIADNQRAPPHNELLTHACMHA